MAIPHTPPRINNRSPKSCKTQRSGPYWVLESSMVPCHSVQPALEGSRSKLDACHFQPESSPTPITHLLHLNDSEQRSVPNLAEEEQDTIFNTPPAARIFFGTPGTAERQVVQRLDASSSIGTVYEIPTPPLPTTPDSSPGVGRVASPSWDLVEHRSILRDALGDVSNTSSSRFSPRSADIYQSKCTNSNYVPMRSFTARPSNSLTPVQSVLQDWASSTFASSRTSPMKTSPHKVLPMDLQRQNKSSGHDVFSSPSVSSGHQSDTPMDANSSAALSARTTSTASTINASSAKRVLVVPEHRIHAQRVPNFSQSISSPFAKPSRASLAPATRVPAQRSAACTPSGSGQPKAFPERASRPQRLTRYASHVPATRVWDSPEKLAQKRARIPESSQSIQKNISQSKHAAKNCHQPLRKNLHKDSLESKDNNTSSTRIHSPSISSASQKGDAQSICSISPSKHCTADTSYREQAPSNYSEEGNDTHTSANQASKIAQQQDAHCIVPCKSRDAAKAVNCINQTDSNPRLLLSSAPTAPSDQPEGIDVSMEIKPVGQRPTSLEVSSSEAKDTSQASRTFRHSSESIANARNLSATSLNPTRTGSARNLRTSTRISRKPTPAPLPMSAAELARITAKHTKQNEQYSIDLRTQEFHLAGPRPPSPSQAFHVDARPREPHWQRACHVETNERGEPMRHARGAGDTEEYTTPPQQGRTIHWDKRLVVSPSLRPARQDLRSQRACLRPARITLDTFGNVPYERKLNSRRQSVVIKRVVYENDDNVDNNDDGDS